MSTLYFDSSNFEIRHANDKKYFSIKTQPDAKIHKLCLVYFFTANCQYCKEFSTFFDPISTKITGQITFARCNAGNASMFELLKASVMTTTPITEVPYVLLFHDGWPIRRYDGQANITTLSNFINSVKNEISEMNRSMANQSPSQQKTPQIQPISQLPKNPNYSCYLPFDQAYKTCVMQKTPDSTSAN